MNRKLLKLIKEEEAETKEHLKRVKILTELLMTKYNAGKINMPEHYSKKIIKNSVLHDIGKIAIPKEILYKTGQLTEYERKIIETHPIVGVQILEKNVNKEKETTEDYQIAKNIILYHHERWDGAGYPSKMKKEAIPFEARVMTIVDVFDALTSERCYKKAWTNEKALRYIEEKKGEIFDPRLAETFLSLKENLIYLKK